MSRDLRPIAEGAVFGVMAGVVFAVAQMALAVMAGHSPIQPWQYFASVVQGHGALMASPMRALMLGIPVHLALSSVFGVIYGALIQPASQRTRTSLARESALGMLFGLCLYLVNFQVLARIAAPWFIGLPQVIEAVLHAVAFGLPLSLLVAAGEKTAYAYERRHFLAGY